MKTILELRKEKGVLIAAHRGSWGGNIPANSLASFELAMRDGADILEMDLIKSADGEIFVFHSGMEFRQLDRHIHINALTSAEISNLKLCNVDGTETFLPVNKFDEVLDFAKNKCILNLDRCIVKGDRATNILKEAMEKVKNHNMQEQILLKTDPSDESLKTVETFARGISFMPIFMECDNASEKIEKMDINYIGAELVFKSEDSPIAQDSYIEMMHKKGRVLWGNSIVYSSKVPLAAGHNDDISLTDNPEKGWGWLVSKGFDIIQTDWALHLHSYLKEKKDV